MTSPINLQIRRTDHSWDIIEAAPLLIEQDRELVPTGSYQLYRGFPEFDSYHLDHEALRDRYMESIELTGEDNPGYLGELHFTGLGYYEWRYEGEQLQENEVWQIVDCIQDLAAGNVREMVNGIIQPRPGEPEDNELHFRYGKGRTVSDIKLEQVANNFTVLVNGRYSAQLKKQGDSWTLISGEISDRDLLADILRRIRANS